MTNISQTAPVAQVNVLGLAQQLMQRISTATAERRASFQSKAAAHALQKMDARLLDDIGVESLTKGEPTNSYSSLNPMAVALSVFSAPHNGR